MNSKLIKVLGLTASVVGMAATLLSDWVNEQKMDEKIKEKVNEAIAKKRTTKMRSPDKGSFLFTYSRKNVVLIKIAREIHIISYEEVI